MTALNHRMPTFDLPATRLPLALADAHRSLAVGERVEFRVRPRVGADRLRDVVNGAGFTIDHIAGDGRYLCARATRARTLPDYVAPGMRVLFVGLNPSEYAADAGVGFARPGNRFWPALLEAAVVTRDREPRHALVHHRVGMTDLVKRATPRADALSPHEYREGAERAQRLVSWLAPGAVCIVGLTGWRHAIDRHAAVGWQEEPFGGRPVYVMPNTSGLNARVPLAAFARHVASASAAQG